MFNRFSDARIGRRTVLAGGGAATLASTTSCGLWSRIFREPTLDADTWANASRTVEVHPKVLARPQSAADLVKLVQEAESHGMRVRMTGSGHSYSDVALSDDYLLMPHGLQQLLPLDPQRLFPAAAADPHLVRVGSGSTLRYLNEKLAEKKLAFTNLGGWDAQTIVGAFTTGTHGSGLAYGPIAEQIVSLQIVSNQGKLIQVEPSNGITKRAGFPGHLEEDASIPLMLEQRDDWFQSLLVSMGCMGVVYSVVLKAVDRFWIRETRKLKRWRELSKPGGYLDGLTQRPRDANYPDHVEITVCPYGSPDDASDHDVLLTERFRTSVQPSASDLRSRRGALGNGHILTDAAVRRVTERSLAKSMDDAKLHVLSGIHRGLMLAVVDPKFVSESYNVFNFGEPNLLRVFGVELAFELHDARAAVERVFTIAAQQFEAGRHHSVPVTLRFVKAAEPFLAMQYGRDTAMLEIGSLVASRGSAELLKNYEQVFFDEFGARPHWGLDLSFLTSFEQVRRLYPKADAWLDAFQQLNPAGTFDGRLTDRLHISRRQRS